MVELAQHQLLLAGGRALHKLRAGSAAVRGIGEPLLEMLDGRWIRIDGEALQFLAKLDEFSLVVEP